MRFYSALAVFLFSLLVVSWIAASARHHAITAILFGYFGYAFRSDIDTAVRRANEKLDEWWDE